MNMVTGYSLGYQIEYLNNQWVYSDTRESIINNSRPCKHCGKYPMMHGYDYCLGKLPNVQAGCCGHNIENPYVVFNDGQYKQFNSIRELKDYFNKNIKG